MRVGVGRSESGRMKPSRARPETSGDSLPFFSAIYLHGFFEWLSEMQCNVDPFHAPWKTKGLSDFFGFARNQDSMLCFCESCI